MVCLYGVTLTHIEESLTKQDLENYPIWSWLIHRLTKFIYDIDLHNGTNVPYIPKENDNSVYAKWFNTTLVILKETFYDATQERLYKCCEDTPNEKVATIIYDATPLELLYAFKNNVQQHAIEIATRMTSMSALNPANDVASNENSESDSLPELESDNDSLPELESDNDSLPELESDNDSLPELESDNDSLPELIPC